MTNLTLNVYKNVCKSCTIYKLYYQSYFIIRINIIYFNWCTKKSNNDINPNTIKQVNIKNLTHYFLMS